MQTTISLPENVAKEVEEQVKKGRFRTQSAFVTPAVKTLLSLQKGDVTWETLASPFRAYAKKKKLTEKDIFQSVMNGRRAKTSKNSYANCTSAGLVNPTRTP